MTQALSAVMEAAGMTGSDKNKLTALLQSQDSDDDDETGAPAAASYENKSGGIVDVLNGMKDKAEGDLSQTTKDLAEANNDLATVHGDCLTVAGDHETTVAARAEELKVIATAKKILEESTGGAVSQSYSLLQLKMNSRADLKNNEVVA